MNVRELATETASRCLGQLASSSVSQPSDVSACFAAAISAGDADGAVKYWAPDALMVGADGTTARGRAALLAVFRQLVSAGAQLVIEAEEQWDGPGVALARTRMSMTTGEERLQLHGTVVYVQVEDGWRIAIDQVTYASP